MGYIETFENVDDDSYLEHYGVKGMHWGYRKLKNYGSTKGDKEYIKKLSTMTIDQMNSDFHKIDKNISRAVKDRKYRESPQYEQQVRNSIALLGVISGVGTAKNSKNGKASVSLKGKNIVNAEKIYSSLEKDSSDDYAYSKSIDNQNKGLKKFNSDFNKKYNISDDYDLNKDPKMLKKYDDEAAKWITSVEDKTFKDLGFEQSAFDDLYLEHFGIRGMHWGHRKSKTWSSQNKTHTSGKGTKQKMSTKKKVALGATIVGGTLLATYGGYKAAKFIKSKDAQKIKDTGEILYDNFAKSKKVKSINNYADILSIDSKGSIYKDFEKTADSYRSQTKDILNEGRSKTDSWVKDTLTNRKFKDSFDNVVLKKDKGTTVKLIKSLDESESKLDRINDALGKTTKLIDERRMGSGINSWNQTIDRGTDALNKAAAVDDYTQELLRRGRV
jgi:hypothetical protein